MSFNGNNVMEAVQALFQGSSLPTLTSDGKLWEIEAPEGTLFPFAEFFRVSQPVEAYTTGFLMPRCTIQFSFHAANPDTARDMADAFSAAYTYLGDGASPNSQLTIGGVPVLHVLPGEPSSAKGEGKGPQGQDSYMEMLEIDVLFAKSY
jgi:hypothetical protein